jgi:hypothetical protein
LETNRSLQFYASEYSVRSVYTIFFLSERRVEEMVKQTQK